MILNVQACRLSGVKSITLKTFKDDRGFFFEAFKKPEWDALGLESHFVQDNFSQSSKGVLRGLHFQKGQYAQGKLVGLLKGEAYTVVVDLRRTSTTFGQWESFSLNSETGNWLYLPPGLAHGFLTLTQECIYYYKVTQPYAEKQEAGLIWNDEFLNIQWPMKDVVVSEKDKILPNWEAVEKFD